MSEPLWLEWARQLQAIAQIGLHYTKDPFDKERYTQLQTLAIEIIRKQLFMVASVQKYHISKYKMFDFYHKERVYYKKTTFYVSCSRLQMERKAFQLLRYVRFNTDYFKEYNLPVVVDDDVLRCQKRCE